MGCLAKEVNEAILMKLMIKMISGLRMVRNYRKYWKILLVLNFIL